MGGIVKWIEEELEDLPNTVSDIQTQLTTGGLVRHKNDRFTTGVVSTPVVDPIITAIKDVTGAKAAEEAIKESKRQFQEMKSDEEKKRKETKAQSAREQLFLSRQAGAARSFGGMSFKNKNVSRYSILGSDEQDFLGL